MTDAPLNLDDVTGMMCPRCGERQGLARFGRMFVHCDGCDFYFRREIGTGQPAPDPVEAEAARVAYRLRQGVTGG